jgi:hypothetical protein
MRYYIGDKVVIASRHNYRGCKGYISDYNDLFEEYDVRITQLSSGLPVSSDSKIIVNADADQLLPDFLEIEFDRSPIIDQTLSTRDREWFYEELLKGGVNNVER